jgi:hypothetical protein
MRKCLFLVTTICLLVVASYAQPLLSEGASIAGIQHNAQMCDIDMPGQGGAAWFDYNDDGWYDLYLTGGCARDALFRNDGGGSFTNVTFEAGFGVLYNVETDGVTTGDFNSDGYPDVLVTTFKSSANFLFLNNGDETFQQIQWAGDSDTANSFSAVFGDIDLDGWLDIYICNWSTDFEVTIDGPSVSVDSKPNYYYRNNGDGTFSERAEQAEIGDSLGCALGVLLTDFDNDQDPDILVANDLGYFNGNSPNQLFRNQYPLDAFTEESEVFDLNVEMNGMGMAKADINLDGVFEYYITNRTNDKLLVREGGGFEDQAVQRGLKNDSVWVDDFSEKTANVGWGAAFMDLDNDMDEDLMVANGSLGYGVLLPALDSNKLYLNDGLGNFTNISRTSGVADTYVSRALAYCDYNLDGKLDVFVGVTDEVDGTHYSMLYRNISPDQNWLQVKCKGVQNNRDGIGAVVRLYVNDIMQTREIGGESSFNSQHWNVAHFGLGTNQVVDSLQIYWPAGLVDTYYSPTINEFLGVSEGQGTVTNTQNHNSLKFDVYPNPFSDYIRIESDEGSLIELFDAKGAVVISKLLSSESDHVFETADLPAGNYLIKSSSESGYVVTRKLVKQ